MRCSKSIFKIHDNLLEMVESSDSLKADLVRMRVSMSMLRDALGRPDYIPPPKKTKKTTGMIVICAGTRITFDIL